MTKRQAVEWCYLEGFSAEFALDKLYEKHPGITLEWIQEVYDEMEEAEDDY